MTDAHLKFALYICVNHCQQESGKTAKTAVETSDFDIGSKHSSMVEVAVPMVSTSNGKSKKKKKKKKVKEDSFPSIEDDVKSSNLMLENLSLGASSSDSRISQYPAKPKLVQMGTDERIMKKHCKSSILQIDPKFLRAENELRRIFGSKVVKSYEKSNASVNSRMTRGGRRGIHNLKKTILVSPSQHWPRWDGSLTMELLETRDDIHYFK